VIDTEDIPVRKRPLESFGTDQETDADLVTYVIVGRAVIHWGSLEQNFNNLIAKLFKRYGEGQHPPFALKRKIEFWNDCFQKQNDLDHVKASALQFSRDLIAAKKHRDNLLHFAWEAGDAEKPMKGRSLKIHADGHVQKNMEIELRAINALSSEVSRLNLSLLPLVFDLLRPARPK
jgi:hypothetical protein